MQRAALPILLAVIFILIAIFYLIPGINHPLVSEDPLGRHVKHTLLFAALALLSLVWARFATNATR